VEFILIFWSSSAIVTYVGEENQENHVSFRKTKGRRSFFYVGFWQYSLFFFSIVFNSIHLIPGRTYKWLKFLRDLIRYSCTYNGTGVTVILLWYIIGNLCKNGKWNLKLGSHTYIGLWFKQCLRILLERSCFWKC